MENNMQPDIEFDRENPEPGLYENLANDLYHGSPGLSKSGIALIRECPAKYHWRYILGNSGETTKAMQIGDALHCLVLEPAIFTSRFAVSPKFDGRTKDGKAGKAQFASEHAGKSVINEEEFALIDAMANAVHSHPAAAYLLGLGGICEESFFWREEFTGSDVLCKCRPDLRIPSKRILVDLKSTSKGAGTDAFARTMLNMTYHIQSGHYLDGVSNVLQEQYDEFIFIAVEAEPPHLVAVYQLDRDSVEMGKREAQAMIRLFAKCRMDGYWPGYGDTIQTINLPRWAKEVEVSIYE
jgi:exodeoxyribonuclease VIII